MLTQDIHYERDDDDRVDEITQGLKRRAHELGFSLVGIAPAVAPPGYDNLFTWLEQGFAGEMRYMENRRDAYSHPRHVLKSVRSVVMLGLDYRNEDPPAALESGFGRVSRYAWGEADYHSVIRTMLHKLATFLHDKCPDCRTRGVVDTAPLLERDFGRLAGLGWFGKNTMLINKRRGSWFFLASLLTDVALIPDAAHETSHCGTCTRCLDACPTNAFPEPFVLDATRCVSYLTIELRNEAIPPHLREGCGEWLFGCDICQDVCPWNRKAPQSTEPQFMPADGATSLDAVELLQLDEHGFLMRFPNSPLVRAGRGGLLRNACLVLGNTGNQGHVPQDSTQ